MSWPHDLSLRWSPWETCFIFTQKMVMFSCLRYFSSMYGTKKEHNLPNQGLPSLPHFIQSLYAICGRKIKQTGSFVVVPRVYNHLTSHMAAVSSAIFGSIWSFFFGECPFPSWLPVAQRVKPIHDDIVLYHKVLLFEFSKVRNESFFVPKYAQILWCRWL